MMRTNRITLSLVSLFLIIIFSGYAFAADFTLPPYQKSTMDNGLTVYLMEQHEVPLIYVSLVFPAGSIRDGEKSGLANLTADALLFGTRSYSKKQLEQELDYEGVSYSSSASKEIAKLTMSFVKDDQDKILSILKEIVTAPTFNIEEFNKHKQRLLDQLDLIKERPQRVIRAYYDKFLFGDHVYGNSLNGTKQTVSAITIDDVKAFYAANYQPAGAAIAVVGDFKTNNMKKNLARLFVDWKSTTQPQQLDISAVTEPANNRLLLVNKDDATETRFLIGSTGIKRSNPDYVAVQVINTILGGRFTSWLNDELRVNRGLTYGAYSYFSAFRQAGIFVMSSFTPTEKTIEAIDLAVEVLQRLHRQGVDEETLNSAKNYIKGQFPPEYETAGDLARLLTQMFVYHFDESFIINFQQNVDAMTVDRAKQIIATYFPQDKLQFVLIGKADEIRDAVKKYGELTEKDIKADGY